MKISARSILFTGIVAILSAGSLLAQATNAGFEQWYRAKFGRPSPAEQARLNSDPVRTASAHATPQLAAQASNSGFEQRYRAKVGRPSPAEEARLKSAQGHSDLAPVLEPAVAVSTDGGFETRYRAKVGRPSPAVEARRVQTRTAEDLSKAQLNALIATAKTPAEHRRIAQFYQAQTQHYLALSMEHETMLATYTSTPGLTNNKNEASTVNHCAHFVQEFNGLAAKSNELAELQEQMAAEAAKM